MNQEIIPNIINSKGGLNDFIYVLPGYSDAFANNFSHIDTNGKPVLYDHIWYLII